MRALFALWWLAGSAWAGEVTVDFLDVGQGDSILIRGGGKTVLIDAGIKRARVADQLRALDVERLDLVVTTHPHADHMGGMEDVVRSFPVGLYMDNGLPHTTQTYDKLMIAIEELEIPYRSAHTGMDLNLGDEAVMHVLLPGDTPLTNTRSDLNSNSVVTLLSHGDVDFLFTGDAEEPTEHILARQEIPHLEVLKVAHHGSAHSSTSAFLRSVDPDYAIISCGTDNRYGHPDPEALERIGATGALVFRTDLSGHLRAVSNGTTVEILELGDFTGISIGTRPSAVAGPPRSTNLPGRIGPGAVGTPAATSATTPAVTATTPATAEPPDDDMVTGLDLSGVRPPPEPVEEQPERPRRRRRKRDREQEASP